MVNNLIQEPLYSLNDPLIVEIRERILSFSESKPTSPDICWNWIGNKTDRGYGTVSFLGKPRRVHRIIYWIEIKECKDNSIFNSDIIIRHKCDNPACINSKHLIEGTYLDNAKDRDARHRNGQANKTHCSKGHEFTPDNTYIRPDNGNRICIRCRAINEYYRMRY